MRRVRRDYKKKKEKREKARAKGKREEMRPVAAYSAFRRPARDAVPYRLAHLPLAPSAYTPEAQGKMR
jgi:hypothetical protein